MITLITGLPGNGKTLYALNFIKAYSESENREVFYSGIKDLQLPWTEIKAEDWPALPAGSIIVIDECQFIFPKKPNGSKLPEHYEKLAVHRHSGYDIFLITQHPTLIDNFVRQLCGRHLHLIRKFGMQRANVWEWPGANSAPEKSSSWKNAIQHKFSYPKEVYSYYKSAEVHTVKRSIPVKLILAAMFALSVPAIGYYVLDHFQNRGKRMAEPNANGSSASVGAVQSSGQPRPKTKAELTRDYIDSLQDRIPGLPHTQPKYDEVTKPMTVPMPVACVSAKDRCSCFTQQATKMTMADATCRAIVKNGFFVDFEEKQVQRRQDDFQLVSDSRAGQNPIAPQTVAYTMPPEGYGVLGKQGAGVRYPGQLTQPPSAKPQ